MAFRLRRDRAWGLWYLTVNGKSLVHESRDSAFYEVPLEELATPEDARLRVETVVALKSAWVDQRVVDDLRRAFRAVKNFEVPFVACEQRR